MSGQTSTSTTNPFGPKPFGTTKSFRSPTGTSILGGMSTGVFGQPSTPAFGASSAPAFGSSMPSFGASSAPAFGSSPFGDSSLFGQNSSFISFGSSPSQSNPFRSTFQQTQPSFGNDLFGSVSQFSTPSQPAFGSNTTSAFGLVSTPSFGTSPTFGASSTPAFGSTMTPVFAASSTPAFGSTTTSTFGSTSTSPFGNTGSSFGVSSFPAFGSTPTVSFGTPSTPTFGSSNTPAFGASTAFAFGTPTVFGFCALSSPSFSLGSTPSFGQSASAFGSTPFGALPSPFSIQSSPFGAQTTIPTFGSPSFGQPALWSQPGGTRVAPYSPTPEIDGGTSYHPFGILESISAIPVYKDKSHEELRWEHYQRGDKGGPNPFEQSATPINLATSSQPSLFGPTINQLLAGAQATSLFGSMIYQLLKGAQATTPYSPSFGQPDLWSQSRGTSIAPYSRTPEIDGGTNNQPDLWSQPRGTSIAPYSPTPEIDGDTNNQPFHKLESITAIPVYKNKSHEELRWEDYQRGDKGAQATTPTFGSPSFRQPSLWSQPGGTRVSPYSPTPEIDDGTSNQPFGKLESICAIPLYKDKSHEELRWEDYQRGDKGSSMFGQNPAFGSFGSSLGQSSPFSSTFQQTQPSFGSNLVGSVSQFSSSNQPAFGSSTTSAFGSTSTSSFGATTAPSFGTTSPAYGAPSAPAFGSITTPVFGALSTPAFGSTTIPASGSTSTSLFGNTSSPFGVSSFPAFGSTPTISFGTPITPTFGSSSTSAFGASTASTFGIPTVSAFGALSSPSFSFGSTPSFGQSASAFGSTPFGASPSPVSSQSSPFGAATTPTFGSPSFGQPALWSQQGGTRVAPYSPTPEIDGGTSNQPFGKLESISAIPVYKDNSHEELRWEDYQRGDNGGPNPFGQTATPINLATSSQPIISGSTAIFGQSVASPFPSSSSNLFALKSPGFGSSGFALASTSLFSSPFTTTPSNPFGSNSSTTSLFGALTGSSFGASASSPAFGGLTTSAFGSSTSPFGSSIAGSGSPFGTGMAFGNSQSSGMFQSTVAPFGQTSSLFGQTSTGFQHTTSAFGSSLFSNQSSTFGGSLFSSSTPTLFPSSTPGFGLTTTSFQVAPATQTNTFSFMNLGQTSPASPSAFGSTSYIFSQGVNRPMRLTRCQKKLLPTRSSKVEVQGKNISRGSLSPNIVSSET